MCIDRALEQRGQDTLRTKTLCEPVPDRGLKDDPASVQEVPECIGTEDDQALLQAVVDVRALGDPGFLRHLDDPQVQVLWGRAATAERNHPVRPHRARAEVLQKSAEMLR